MTQMGGKRLGGRLGTMSDFWLWAFGDLRSNNVRGVFAEWMVAQILGLEPNPRGSWDNYDLQLRDGRTVEVKASAYLQVWHTAAPPVEDPVHGSQGEPLAGCRAEAQH